MSRFSPPDWRMTSAVITLVMEAIGRGTLASLDQRTWPVVASTRMPALALTPRGAPTTSSAGPAGSTAVLVAAAGGTVAVIARPGDAIAAGLVAPCASGTT